MFPLELTIDRGFGERITLSKKEPGGDIYVTLEANDEEVTLSLDNVQADQFSAEFIKMINDGEE
jgi:hypothetical protein